MPVHRMVPEVFGHEVHLSQVIGRCGHRPDVAGILLVHGDDHVEAVEIGRRELPCPTVELIPMFGSMRPHSFIRQIAHMPVSDTRRIGLKSLLQVMLPNKVIEYASAAGDLQILPRQTKSNLVFPICFIPKKLCFFTKNERKMYNKWQKESKKICFSALKE